MTRRSWSSCLTRVSTESALVCPVAANTAAISASSPGVDRLASVLPSRKAPHSGWPNLPQPSALVTAPSSSLKPRFCCGQPRAWAIGLGIAITIGVVATLGFSRGISTGWLAACCRSATWSAQAEEAGTQTSGRAPWVASSQPVERAAAASTESVALTRTSTQRLSATGRRRSYSAAAWDTTPAWSGETTTWSGTSPERQARLWAGWLTKSTNPPMPSARTSRMQAAATSAVGRRRRRWARCLPPTDARSFSI